jgi:hypothetical protein
MLQIRATNTKGRISLLESGYGESFGSTQGDLRMGRELRNRVASLLFLRGGRRFPRSDSWEKLGRSEYLQERERERNTQRIMTKISFSSLRGDAIAMLLGSWSARSLQREETCTCNALVPIEPPSCQDLMPVEDLKDARHASYLPLQLRIL